MRALGAAETGLSIAQARLQEAANRFIVTNSTVDTSTGSAAWGGSIAAFGSASIEPPNGFSEATLPFNIASAIANRHAADQNIVTDVGIATPTIGYAMADASLTDYAATNWVYTPAISLESGTETPLCFQITYAPLANGTDVRAIVTGYDYAYQRNGHPLARTIMQDFRIAKRVNQAIISPSRVMIGKNVNITGDVGLRFTDVTFSNGHPLIFRSDFYGLTSGLDTNLDDFFDDVRTFDVDGDNRLRVGHATEAQGTSIVGSEYNSDATADGYVDDFDVFINHFDVNGDNKVALSDALRLGTPSYLMVAELVRNDGTALDEDLGVLIDSANPDRNKNGVWGFTDTNSNGVWDSGEAFTDYDTDNASRRDQVLGFRDGVLDYKDQYAKVAGRLVFRATSAAWSSAQGADYLDNLRGTIRNSNGQSPVLYGANSSILPDFDAASFIGARSALVIAADGGAFSQQVATQLGVSVAALATYVEASPSGSTSPRFLRVDPDVNLDGRPDNYTTAYFEKMPYNSPSHSDYYYRPVYENMVFKNCAIPAGTNALFRNCTFVGATYVRTTGDNAHVLWSEYGKMQLNATDQLPEGYPLRTIYGDSAGENSYPAMLPTTAQPPNQMILMAMTLPMDQADLPASAAGGVNGFANLPMPLVVGGLRITDTKPLSNNLRFHDCLFVGSIVSDTPTIYTQVRNKLQFTGGTRFTEEHPTYPGDANLNPDSGDLDEIAKSSMMLPNYSVDIGSFNSPSTQNVRLRGAIVAGVLDIRGNTSIDGALLLTYSPVRGVAPMLDSLLNPIGNPAGFNATIGYFGPDDGDSESLNPDDLPTVGGVKIVGYDTNGDGLADVAYNAPQPPGSVTVPFHGFGRVQIRFDPNMALPDGVPLPLQFIVLGSTYREGKP
jgi:hypothetical protein